MVIVTVGVETVLAHHVDYSIILLDIEIVIIAVDERKICPSFSWGTKSWLIATWCSVRPPTVVSLSTSNVMVKYV